MPRRKQTPVQQPTPAPIVLAPMLTMRDMQTLLHLSKPKIYELIEEGLPTLKIGGARRFDSAEVHAWIAQQKAKAS